MIWDYSCSQCGRREERQVPVPLRDQQNCDCGARMARLAAFGKQHVVIPAYMRAGHDETTYIPAEPKAREKFLADAYRQHGRWRTDLEQRARAEALAANPEPEPEPEPVKPRKTTRQVIEEALRETYRTGGRTPKPAGQAMPMGARKRRAA